MGRSHASITVSVCNACRICAALVARFRGIACVDGPAKRARKAHAVECGSPPVLGERRGRATRLVTGCDVPAPAPDHTGDDDRGRTLTWKVGRHGRAFERHHELPFLPKREATFESAGPSSPSGSPVGVGIASFSAPRFDEDTHPGGGFPARKQCSPSSPCSPAG